MSDQSEIYLWTMSLRVTERRFRELRDTLSPEELARAARYRFPAPARRFTVARGRLRELLGRYLEIPPAEVKLETNQWGKPRLAGSGNLHFNLAHSEDLAIYAFAQKRPLGVDIEKVRPLENFDGMVARSFSPAEQEALRALPPEKRLTAFFATWTRKEAYMKARGLGFHLSPQAFDVTVSPTAPPQILNDLQSPVTPVDWTCHDLEVGEGFVGAVVVGI
ncbi:MAG: 4'-phosphopantetheinyl transferase Sfp [Chloroflexi bacterium]|nr:4'-phosphopantetheinyl transferase Sfp [Chloroflexota bacterium]